MQNLKSPGDGGGGRDSMPAAGLLLIIRLYQLTLSAIVGRRCRHLPTCSNYTAEAIRRHGAWRGVLLGTFRIMRCHPWGTQGFDPVPEKVPANPCAFYKLWKLGRKPN